VAQDIDDLHSDDNHLTKQTVLDEKGEMTNGRGDSPNRHDILTGSQLDGTAVPGDEDTTCQNWTGSGDGSAMVGHFDRTGGGQNPTSWNAAHGSRGCSQENLQATSAFMSDIAVKPTAATFRVVQALGNPEMLVELEIWLAR